MKYKLYLDDIRHPRHTPEYRDFDRSFFLDIKIARTYDEAVNIMNEHGIPSVLMLDYDLGADIHLGIDVVNHFISLVKENPSALDPEFIYFVHSNSKAGAALMRETLDNFLKELGRLK
ncbi:MAG TPA: hypothetical protein PLW78_12115 [bacterium]|jgi:hypothetical protein|nr:hypothetical protein [bacterium]